MPLNKKSLRAGWIATLILSFGFALVGSETVSGSNFTTFLVLLWLDAAAEA